MRFRFVMLVVFTVLLLLLYLAKKSYLLFISCYISQWALWQFLRQGTTLANLGLLLLMLPVCKYFILQA